MLHDPWIDGLVMALQHSSSAAHPVEEGPLPLLEPPPQASPAAAATTRADANEEGRIRRVRFCALDEDMHGSFTAGRRDPRRAVGAARSSGAAGDVPSRTAGVFGAFGGPNARVIRRRRTVRAPALPLPPRPTWADRFRPSAVDAARGAPACTVGPPLRRPRRGPCPRRAFRATPR